jgi:hypothetical protein
MNIGARLEAIGRLVPQNVSIADMHICRHGWQSVE